MPNTTWAARIAVTPRPARSGNHTRPATSRGSTLSPTQTSPIVANSHPFATPPTTTPTTSTPRSALSTGHPSGCISNRIRHLVACASLWGPSGAMRLRDEGRKAAFVAPYAWAPLMHKASLRRRHRADGHTAAWERSRIQSVWPAARAGRLAQPEDDAAAPGLRRRRLLSRRPAVSDPTTHVDRGGAGARHRAHQVRRHSRRRCQVYDAGDYGLASPAVSDPTTHVERNLSRPVAVVPGLRRRPLRARRPAVSDRTHVDRGGAGARHRAHGVHRQVWLRCQVYDAGDYGLAAPRGPTPPPTSTAAEQVPGTAPTRSTGRVGGGARSTTSSTTGS